MPVLNVSRLSITLKLPLAFFQSVEGLSGNYPTSSEIGPATQPARLWQDLGSILSRFEALKKLDLWLDHNEPQFWVVVNERSTLDPLLIQLSSHPNLDVTVMLPMLHPKFEQSERHYTEDSISGNIRNRFIPDLASLNAFAQGYERLQHDNDHLRDELAERTRTHEQAITQLRHAAEHQVVGHAATLKATNEEMHILRREKESLKESIENMEFQITPVNDEVTRLRAENARLRRWVHNSTLEVKRLHDKIKDCNKSFEGYKKRVKALVNED
ncbi:hypothetical protein J4E90_003893 [Alternaria incomplexa]|uniref:uncharacterized protein n=1 Tax=Alternaria incomplexa TaxID=1187928 RepID=UPI00221F7A11|nr:uncharacterized protein J4E90_003893 [Alternaria incomplexa]KAI4917386.1 hypothetical protein J4E90_003893 [Alternaria incomplexa]